MKNISLQEHIARSKAAVEANNAKGNRHGELISGLYTKPERFVDEILQNAEDAYRKRKDYKGECSVLFRLFGDRLEIYHNGKDFDEEDLKSITTFANSSKVSDNEINAIGKFGIGFKSVFAICDFPHIFSGGHSYKIVDYELLESVKKPKADKKYNTLILLPLKKNEDNDIFELVKNALLCLDSTSILFLDKISRLDIEIAEDKFSMVKKEDELSDNLKKVVLENSLMNLSEQYIVLSKELKNRRHPIEIALKAKEIEGKEVIVPVSSACVYMYFSTHQQSGLNFLLHGPYSTTPSRENIPVNDSKGKENLKLIKESAAFFASSFIKLRDSGFLTIDFFKILPLKAPANNISEKTENYFYNTFYEEILKALKTKKLLPSKPGGFVYSKDAAYTDDKNIANLLDKKGLEILFNRKSFLEEAFSEEASDELKNYLTNKAGIEKIDSSKFAFRLALNPLFLEQKKEKWFRDFYLYLSNNPQLWDKRYSSNYFNLRKVSFVMLNNNKLAAPFDNNDNVKIYLPSGRMSDYQIVKKSLLKDAEILSFFKLLGLSIPDIVSEVTELILPKYLKYDRDITAEENYYDLRKILLALKEISTEKKDKLKHKLKDIPFIKSANIKTGETKFCSPIQTYADNDDLKGFFKDVNVYFVDERSYLDFDKNKEQKIFTKELLLELGINENPQKIIVKEEDSEFITLEGLGVFFGKADYEKSKALLNILSKCPLEFFYQDEDTGFKGKSIGFAFLNQLKTNEWIIGSDKSLNKPECISPTDVAEVYDLSEMQIRHLNELFSFKIDLFFSKDEKKMLEYLKMNNIDIGSLKQKADNKRILIEWNPKIEAENAVIMIYKKDNNELTSSSNLKEFVNIQQDLFLSLPAENESLEISPDKESIQKINKWGKDYVYKALCYEFQNDKNIEIIRNESLSNESSFDFIIIKDKNIFKQIEVASKRGLDKYYFLENPQSLKINDKEDCFLYCVDNVGQENACIQIIQDPFSKFKSGEISISNIKFQI